MLYVANLTVLHISSIITGLSVTKLVTLRLKSFQEENTSSMKGTQTSRWLWITAFILVVIAAVWFWRSHNASSGAQPQAKSGQTQQAGHRGMRGGALAPVQAATATSEAVPHYLTGLGTITAANTVTVRSRVDGQLLAIHFQEGQQVKAGDLLAEIDRSLNSGKSLLFTHQLQARFQN